MRAAAERLISRPAIDSISTPVGERNLPYDGRVTLGANIQINTRDLRTATHAATVSTCATADAHKRRMEPSSDTESAGKRTASERSDDNNDHSFTFQKRSAEGSTSHAYTRNRH